MGSHVNPGEVFARRLTLARIRKGWNLFELSKMSGIGYSTLSRYQSGNRQQVSLENLHILADVTGVTVDYLLGRE